MRVTVALNSENRRIGEHHHNAKLTDAEVDLIHELREAGLSLNQLAEKFGVKKACIWKIVTGRTRSHIATQWRVRNVGDMSARARTRVSVKRSLNSCEAPKAQSPLCVEVLQQAIFGWR